ncbi:MAG: hypothetical protein ACYTBJ_16300 [Planctomycetota bacterium]|jgi:hypothetical protein
MANHEAIRRELADWIDREGLGLPLPTTSDLKRDIAAELQRRYTLAYLLKDCIELRAWAYQQSQRSFWFWRNNFAWVFDDIDLGCPIPAIRWSFHGDIQAAYLGLEGWRNSLGERQFMAAKKSRRLGFSVAVCIAAAWGFAVSKEHSGNQIMVSLQAKRVCDNTQAWSSSLFGKVRNILDWQPDWLQPKSWRTSRRFVDRNLLLSCPERDSYIVGLGANVEALRSMRGWRLLFDEANSIPHLDKALAAGQKVGPILCGSSVTTRSTGFWRLCSGDLVPVVEKGGDGCVVLTLHYSQHPMYDPTTEHGRKRIEAEKAQMSEEAWDQEMEVEPAKNSYGLIWASYYDKMLHEVQPDDLREAMTAAMGGVLYEAWDFGDSPALTSWVVGRYVPATDTLYVMDYRSWEHGEASKVAADIGAIGYTTGEKTGMTPAVRVGDIMDGRSNKKTVGGRRQKPIHGWIRNLGREGIRISGQQLEVESAIKTVRDKLIARKIMFMPSSCRRHHRRYPSATECVQEYKRFLPKGVTPEEYEGHATPPPSKGIYSHTADALQHLATKVWGYL